MTGLLSPNSWVCHLDLNCFFAAVQMMIEPALRFVPMAICGSVEDRHGIVLTANYIAKREFGVKTGMTVNEAKCMCKHLVTRPAPYKEILRYSAKALKIGYRYTDRLQRFGMDEFWGDITGSVGLFGSPMAIAQSLNQTFKDELGITCSIGVANNKITAKLASDMKKPDGIVVITPENYEEIVYPLPVSDLLYVGPRRTERLAMYRIKTIGDLAKADLKVLRAEFGVVGEQLWVYANGLDRSPVSSEDEEHLVKSVNNSITAHRDLVSDHDIWRYFIMLAESVGTRAKEQGLKGRTITIWVRDTDLSGLSRQMKMERPTNHPLDIANAAFTLFKRHYRWYKYIRSIGLGVADLVDAAFHRQLDLFTDEARLQKRDDLEQTVFEIRQKYGDINVIQRGVQLTDAKLKTLRPSEDHVFVPPRQHA